MNALQSPRLLALAVGLALALPTLSWAFTSGSSGADGALAPTVNTEVVLPPSGLLNYTSINIPAGVTVTFRKNATNTPVVLLVSGDATIAGTINVSGTSSAPVGAAGDGSIGDDGQPGIGGPGGFSGGRGGAAGSTEDATFGGAGLGPGSGKAGAKFTKSTPCGAYTWIFGGAGAAYSTAIPEVSWCGVPWAAGSAAYGSSSLLPLVGGSGGGGGGGGDNFSGSGGGGGGGALLIAASGTVNVSGSILSNGGASGASSGSGAGASGGGGSGGALRIVATTIAGNGTINALGGSAGSTGSGPFAAGTFGSPGRIRLEAETYSRTAASNPIHTFGTPGPVFIAGMPTLTIANVAGVAVPATPTGVADVSLPASTVNPVAVTFQTTGVPVGNTITVTVTPAHGDSSSAISTALTGTTASATSTASVTLPTGPSTLQATVTYTIVASLGDILSRFAQNERVEQITLSATPGSASKATLITVSGKRYEAPAEALQIAALGG